MAVTRIASLASEEVFPDVEKRVLDAERMTLTEYRFGPATRYPEHTHPQEQMSVVVDGSATFVVAGDAHAMSAGDVIVVPPSVPHAVSAGDGGARLLSVVVPGRRPGDAISLVDEEG